MNKIVSKIKQTQKEISTLLAKEVLHPEVKFAYIDLSLSSGLFLTSNDSSFFQVENQLYEKSKTLSLKNVIVVPSVEALLTGKNCKIEDDILYVGDEFTYRALSTLKTDESFSSFFGFKKIEKITEEVR